MQNWPPLKTLECCPRNLKDYAVWCILTLWPPPDPADLPSWHDQYWQCPQQGPPCNNQIFPQEDETLPQRCPICDTEAVPTTFRLLPPRPPWDETEGA
jgi:hypothetical protein